MKQVLSVDGELVAARGIVLARSRSLTYQLTELGGATAKSRWEIAAELVLGRVRHPVVGAAVGPDTVAYELAAADLAGALWGRLDITATELATAKTARTSVRVWSVPADRTLRLCGWFLRGVLAYTLLALPTLSWLIEKVKSLPDVASLAIVPLVFGSLWQGVRKGAEYPALLLTVTVLAAGWLLALLLNLHVVVNRSLATLPLSGGRKLAPGEHTVHWGEYPGCTSKRGDDTCVVFDSAPESFELALASFLVRQRDEIGCAAIGLDKAYKKAWQDSGECTPEHGVQLTGVQPTKGLGLPPAARKITALLPFRDGALVLPMANHHGSLLISARTTVQGMVLTSSGTGSVTSLVADISPGAVVPIATLLFEKKRQSLRATLQLDHVELGTLTASFQGRPVCHAVTSSSHLGSLVIAGTPEQKPSVFQFSASEPERTHTFLLCWMDSKRPSTGEIHLGKFWAPSEDWTLSLPASHTPRSLSILDREGKHWGTLQCEPSDKGADDFHITPIRINGPRPELRTLTLPNMRAAKGGHVQKKGAALMWRAEPDHATDEWAWVCWQGDAPPAKMLGTQGYWLDQSGDAAGRSYDARKDLEACRICKSSERECYSGCKQARQGPAATIEWFRSFERAPHCHPTKSWVYTCEH